MIGVCDSRPICIVQLESCLKHIFAKYCTPKASAQKHGELLEPPEGAYLSPEGLDSWARDTNGAPFDDATKEELLEFMDVTDDGGLTLVTFPACCKHILNCFS